jgi:hypothetical protein
MAWLWDSWEQYCEWCHPAAIRRGTYTLSRSNTQMEAVRHLLRAVAELRESARELGSMGFDPNGSEQLSYDPALVDRAHNHVIQAIHAGETLLVYHKRLALSDASYGFLHQNDLLEHWDWYAGGNRILHEIQQLVADVGKLLDGYQRMEREDEQWLVEDLDLPKTLEVDFRMSRNLFSVGFDEAGLFLAARGLEKVVREIARGRKIVLVIGKKSQPASRADLHDLIETMARVRWKAKNEPLLTKEAKSLLGYIRTVRNGGAHSGRSDADTTDFRQKAAIIARSANQMWNGITTSRARLAPTQIQKDWP